MDIRFVVLTGDNSYGLLAAKRQRIADFIKAEGDLAIEQFDAEGTEPQIIYDALSNLPFLVSRKLVVIDRPSASKNLTEKMIGWLENLSDSIEVLLIEPQPDKRTVWYKFWSKSGDVKEFRALEGSMLNSWLAGYVKQHGGEIDNAALGELTARSLVSQQALANDLDKLLGANKNITIDLVRELVDPLPQDTVFDMLDAIGAGNSRQVDELYGRLQKHGVDAMEILAMLGWQMHTLALIAAAQNEPDPARATGLHPFVVRKNQSLARNLGSSGIKRMVDEVFAAELQVKKRGLNASAVVGQLLAKLLN